jgi:hypothetical protein
MAIALIGPIGNATLVQDFYRGCPFEVIGPGVIPVTTTDTYKTLEELIDLMLAKNDDVIVIVNHGNPSDGLLMPFTAKSQFTATGGVIGNLTTLAGSSGLSVTDPGLVNAASLMGIPAADALKLVQKLAQLWAKKRQIFVRGCNIGQTLSLLTDYRNAFGAVALQAPNCRMFYLRIRPHKPRKGQTIAGLAAATPAANTRRRQFTDSSATLSPLVIDIRDINGHSQVDTESFSDDPSQAAAWGAKLLWKWQGTTSDFVLQALWDNSLASYATPLETAYTTRFVFAP